MSQWTHVVGCIQCSWNYEEAENLLGKPVLWDDTERLGLQWGTPEYEDYSENVWEKAFEDNEMGFGIPMGSEGSLDWYFVGTKDKDIIGQGSLIAIQGDLRDFGGEKEVNLIIEWFKRATKKVRFATLTIQDDWSDEFVTVTSSWGAVSVCRYPIEERE